MEVARHGAHACKVFIAKEGAIKALGHHSVIPEDPMQVCAECRLNDTCTLKAEGLIFEAGIKFSIKLPQGQPDGVVGITWPCPECSGETHEDAASFFSVNATIAEIASDAICFSCRKKRTALAAAPRGEAGK